MKVEVFYPVSPALRKHIAYYYFLKTDTAGFDCTYYSFPNELQSLNIHLHADCTITDNQICVEGSTRNEHLMILQGKFDTPLQVRLRGLLDKVTIAFKPSALNHFITASFIEVAAQTSQVFTDWNNDDHCVSFLKNFYHADSCEERVAVLENFLLSRYNPLSDEDLLIEAVQQLSNFEEERSIADIAAGMQLHVRSFHRLFYKRVGISPVAFRKIARFRHSLKNKLLLTPGRSLTEIGYGSNFSDQAYFSKVYKKLTGHNPSTFFNNVNLLDENGLVFEFLPEPASITL
ncbi:helix-turn-helix domain-containing protein [Chitinophaga arvensicola]|nr:AraC family transcriptional regulator [Chitinophaga arvensicola]